MDPNDLLSFLDGPGDLATPPSSGKYNNMSKMDVKKAYKLNKR